MLKYPHDRCVGYAQLTDGSGNAYIPDWEQRNDGNGWRKMEDFERSVRFCGAFLIMARRLDPDQLFLFAGEGQSEG